METYVKLPELKRPSLPNTKKNRSITNADNPFMQGKRKPDNDNYNILMFMLYKAGYTQAYLVKRFNVGLRRLREMFYNPVLYMTIYDMQIIASMLKISLYEVLELAMADTVQVGALAFVEQGIAVRKLQELKRLGLIGKGSEKKVQELVIDYMNSQLSKEMLDENF